MRQRFKYSQQCTVSQLYSVVRSYNNEFGVLSTGSITMRVLNSVVVSLALVFATLSVTAQAGPAVDIIFRNNGPDAALYQAITANEISTQANASPRPDDRVQAGSSTRFGVQSNISPDANYASVRYRIGVKSCLFTTSYVKTLARGVTVPKWNKSAVASGGARCDARVVTVNPTSHAWTVEFTMR